VGRLDSCRASKWRVDKIEPGESMFLEKQSISTRIPCTAEKPTDFPRLKISYVLAYKGLGGWEWTAMTLTKEIPIKNQKPKSKPKPKLK